MKNDVSFVIELLVTFIVIFGNLITWWEIRRLKIPTSYKKEIFPEEKTHTRKYQEIPFNKQYYPPSLPMWKKTPSMEELEQINGTKEFWYATDVLTRQDAHFLGAVRLNSGEIEIYYLKLPDDGTSILEYAQDGEPFSAWGFFDLDYYMEIDIDLEGL